MRYSSLHRLAMRTFKETAVQPLRKVKFRERPEDVDIGVGSDAGWPTKGADDVVAIPPSDPQKTAYAPEARRCGGCDREFIATPKLSKLGSPAREQRARRKRNADHRDAVLRRWLRFKHKVRRRKGGAPVAPSTVGS
jgi:hypothetical protein